MLSSVISALFVMAVIMTKPIARVVERINLAVKAAKEEKAARRAAMERYLSIQILDIEH